MAKAKELGIPIISEDDFLAMIINRSKKGTDKEEVKKEIKVEKKDNKGKDKSSPKVKDKKNHDEGKSKKSPTEKNKLESKPKTVKDSASSSKLEVRSTKNRDKSKSPKKVKEETKSESNLETKSNFPENSKTTIINGKYIKNKIPFLISNMFIGLDLISHNVSFTKCKDILIISYL